MFALQKWWERYRRDTQHMKTSKVTEYMIKYLREQEISIFLLSEQTKIPKEKLCPGYQEPLLADEFLRLCVALHLSPEKISKDIKEQKCE